MNIENLQKVADHIRKEDTNVDMGDSLKSRDYGTVGCIAGWACFLAGKEQEAVDMEWNDIRDIATTYLDLSEHEATVLFHVTWWPKTYWYGLMSPTDFTGRKLYNALVADRIEYFIATNGN